MTIQQICTFFLNSTCFGIEVENVQEVIRQQPLTQVPLAAPDICGLMNLRGRIIPVVDLSRRLGLRSVACDIRAGTEDQPIYHIIVNAADDVVSFVVDDIGDVLECWVKTLEPPPATLDLHIRSALKGVYKLEHEFLLVLNTQKALDLSLSGRYS
ncbi:MAG: chemotaxis protein CheW [Cyanobacteria bacterium CRU_2_1]|nr:chemotaxis protein CheW [Cyanobacteria bacterium CRU_2_1]